MGSGLRALHDALEAAQANRLRHVRGRNRYGTAAMGDRACYFRDPWYAPADSDIQSIAFASIERLTRRADQPRVRSCMWLCSGNAVAGCSFSPPRRVSLRLPTRNLTPKVLRVLPMKPIFELGSSSMHRRRF